MPIFAALGAECTVLDYSERQLSSERLVADRECFRVLKHGGYLLSGVDHYINYIVDSDEKEIINHLPFDPLTDEEQRKQLEAGFTLLDLYEDTNGEGRLHELNIPTFLALLSMKKL